MKTYVDLGPMLRPGNPYASRIGYSILARHDSSATASYEQGDDFSDDNYSMVNGSYI